MKNQKIFYAFLWIFLIAVVIFVGINKEEEEILTQSETSEQVQAEISTQAQELSEEIEESEMQGVWISYISLDNSSGDEASFKENFLSYVQTAKENGLTDLFVHIRAFSDALYPSDYYPWSHLLTGTQGQDPNFDPLEFMIEATHEAGLKFHAWINPMRVSLSSIPSELSEDNPYSIYSGENPYYFFEKDGAIYINPAYSEMRSLIANGVAEIVENYDVDGIHFDDYFYPSDMGDLDSSSYDMYCQTSISPISIEEWREANINTMIAQVYRTIKNIDESVVFGISPQGNNSNNISLGANVETWCSTYGYIDYICPQIYFSYENPTLGFSECLDFWTNLYRLDCIDLYIGLGLYKLGTDADSGTWLEDDDIIEKQKIDSLEEADGYILYEISNINNN
ncbi:MAG: family 10 glycosylhydrolase [Clostridia bacterium]